MQNLQNECANGETLLSEEEVAIKLKLAVRTLRNWRWLGQGPPYLKLGGRSVRYSNDAVLSWVSSCCRNSTSDTGENKDVRLLRTSRKN